MSNGGSSLLSAPTTSLQQLVTVEQEQESLRQQVAGKASEDHTHAGYASEDHTHAGYAAEDHAHAGYAAEGHTHTGFAAEDHAHAGYASEGHTHTGFAAEDHRHPQAFYRLSKNQALSVSGSDLDFWVRHPAVTLSLVQSVWNDVAWEDRTIEEQELLALMGHGVGDWHNGRYIPQNFNIYRMTWVGNPDYTIYQSISGCGFITSAAFTKLVSGDVYGYWAEGAGTDWALTGSKSDTRSLRFYNIHPIPLSESGELLFALPAAVLGDVDLSDAENWGLFPHVPTASLAE